MPYTGYCLVRDKNGEPKFDDINDIPQPYWDMLTEDEKQNIIDKRKEIDHGGNSLSSDT